MILSVSQDAGTTHKLPSFPWLSIRHGVATGDGVLLWPGIMWAIPAFILGVMYIIFSQRLVG